MMKTLTDTPISSVAERIEMLSESDVRLDNNHMFSIYDSPPVKARSYNDPPVVSLLSSKIYSNIYMRRREEDVDERNNTRIFSMISDELSDEYNMTSLETWKSYEVNTNSICARRYGYWRSFRLGECILTEPISDDMSDQSVRVQRFSLASNAQPGFVYIFGHKLLDDFFRQSLVRIYWNITQDTAVELTSKLVRLLNDFGIPFTMKVAALHSGYNRSDAGVLYLGKRHILPAIKILRRHTGRLLPLLLDETPLFVKRLAPGVGLAEDPGAGASFGMHRSRLVALGVWQAYNEGVVSTEGKADAIRAAFLQHDVCCDHPYRSLRDTYNLDGLELI